MSCSNPWAFKKIADPDVKVQHAYHSRIDKELKQKTVFQSEWHGSLYSPSVYAGSFLDGICHICNIRLTSSQILQLKSPAGYAMDYPLINCCGSNFCYMAAKRQTVHFALDGNRLLISKQDSPFFKMNDDLENEAKVQRFNIKRSNGDIESWFSNGYWGFPYLSTEYPKNLPKEMSLGVRKSMSISSPTRGVLISDLVELNREFFKPMADLDKEKIVAGLLETCPELELAPKYNMEQVVENFGKFADLILAAYGEKNV